MILQALDEEAPAPSLPGQELEVILHGSLSQPVLGIWQRLEEASRSSLHHMAGWCRSWMDTHPGTYLFAEGRLEGNTVFLLPLAVEKRFGARTARFIGTPFSNINTGLFQSGAGLDPVALRQALTRALKGHADLISLERIPLQWREERSPFAAFEHSENRNRSFQMPLDASFEETLKQVNAKRRRKKYRLQQRRLTEAGGYEILEPQTAAEQHALLDEFFRQKAERFRAQGLPDVFEAPAVKAFFHALLDLPVETGRYALRLHGLRLTAGERPILAIAGTSRKADHIICQFGSIRDDLIPEASPGEFLFWHIIEAACRDGAALFDFGIGDQVYKRSWCTVETVQYDVLLPLTARGQLAAGVHRGINRFKAAIKANPRLYGAIQRLRSGGSEAERLETADGEP